MPELQQPLFTRRTALASLGLIGVFLGLLYLGGPARVVRKRAGILEPGLE